MLDKELSRILDIKEETDQKLIEAYKVIAEFETYKNKITVLLVCIKINKFKVYVQIFYICNISEKLLKIIQDQLESKNQMIETFKLHLDNAEAVLKDQQARADKDKRLFELKVLGIRI